MLISLDDTNIHISFELIYAYFILFIFPQFWLDQLLEWWPIKVFSLSFVWWVLCCYLNNKNQSNFAKQIPNWSSSLFQFIFTSNYLAVCWFSKILTGESLYLCWHSWYSQFVKFYFQFFRVSESFMLSLKLVSAMHYCFHYKSICSILNQYGFIIVCVSTSYFYGVF